LAVAQVIEYIKGPFIVVDYIGTEENDTLNGTPGADLIKGLGGDDFLDGYEGDDTIDGGAG
jgi:Ca2+-binding RTX toxin-like protein